MVEHEDTQGRFHDRSPDDQTIERPFDECGRQVYDAEMAKEIKTDEAMRNMRHHRHSQGGTLTLTQENRMFLKDGERLRQAWARKGNPPCRHRHVGIESTEAGYATRFYLCKQCGTRESYDGASRKKNEPETRTWRFTAALLSGALVGAVLTVLITPERGVAVRQRLSRGVRNIRTEVPQLVSDSRLAYGALDRDARQTVRQTAARLAAILATSLNVAKHKGRMVQPSERKKAAPHR